MLRDGLSVPENRYPGSKTRVFVFRCAGHTPRPFRAGFARVHEKLRVRASARVSKAAVSCCSTTPRPFLLKLCASVDLTCSYIMPLS